MSWPAPLAALRNRTFAGYLGAFVVTQAGFWMSTVTFQWLVARQTDASPSMLGVLAFFNYLPLLVFSLPSGLLADRFDRKRIIIAAWAAIAIIAAALAALNSVGLLTLPVIFIGAFLMGTALALNAPAGQAIIANSVPADNLSSAISLQSASQNVMRIAGPAAATPILLAWGATFSYAAYAIASLLAAAVILRLRIEPASRRDEGSGVFGRFMVGIVHARERHPAAIILASVAVVSLFGFSYVAMLPVFAYKVFHAGNIGFSLLFAATGLGAVLGALSTAIESRPPALTGAGVRTLALGVALVGFASAPSYAIALGLAVLVGAMGFASMTALNTTLQRLIDDDKRGRIMSIFVMCWGGLVPIGSLLMGTLATSVMSIWSVTVMFGMMCLLYGCFMIRLGRQKPWERRLPAAALPASQPAQLEPCSSSD